MRERFVNASPVAEVSGQHAAIDEKEHNAGSMMKRHRRPVRRGREIVFQMKSGVAKRFVIQCKAMFIVAVQPVMRKPTDPF